MEYLSKSDAETNQIGKNLAATLHGGDIVALHGDLGAGKTTFVKGVADGLGIKEEITSPTFTLMNVYSLKSNAYSLKQLVHIDTYRLKNEQELIDIGVEDYLGNPDSICVIEWPEKISGLLKDHGVINITFNHASHHERNITYGHTPYII